MKRASESSVWANDRLRIVVTAACNINCFYCHNEGQPKGNEFLSDALFRKIVELVQASPPKSVTFTGGEALLHPKLEQFIRTIRNICPSITIVTNGTLLDNEKLGALANAGATKIRLGVDSLKRHKSRPSTGAVPYLDVLRRIDAIRAAGLELELNTVLTNFNLAEIPEIFQFCASHSVSAKIFEHVEVERFGSAGASAEIRQRPVVNFLGFEQILRKSGVAFHVSEDPNFRGANYVLSAAGFSWRYCCYLCPFGLCYMTGTRIDATGAAYVCMEKRFVEKISDGDSLAASQSKLQLINEKGCCRQLP